MVNFCTPAPQLVGANYWLPTEPFEFGWANGVGCNNLHCDRCGEPIRIRMLPDGRRRRYACGCQQWQRDCVYRVGDREWDLIMYAYDPPEIDEWVCLGHPELTPPTELDGIELLGGTEWAAPVRAAVLNPPLLLPRVDVGLDVEAGVVWLVRLHRLLDGQAGRHLGQAVVDCLDSRDARLVRAALDFCAVEHEAVGTERIVAAVRRRIDWLAATPDPRSTSTPLLHAADRALVGPGSAARRSLKKPEVLRLAQSLALRGATGNEFWLLERDPDWARRHAGHLVRENMSWLYLLLDASREQRLVLDKGTLREIARRGVGAYHRLRADLALAYHGRSRAAGADVVSDAALARFGGQEQRARDLLTALAWATRGQPADGLTREAWQSAATALAELPGGSGRVYEDEDACWVLRQARDLVRAGEKHNETVYVLRDEALAAYLRRHSSEPTERVRHGTASRTGRPPAAGPASPVSGPVASIVVIPNEAERVAGENPAETSTWHTSWASWHASPGSGSSPATITCAGQIGDVALGEIDGRPIVVVAHDKGPVQLCCARTGKVWRTLGEPGHQAGAVALGLFDGQPVVATAGYDATARLWDARTGKVRQAWGHGSHDFPHYVRAVALAEIHGHPVLATAGVDRTVRLWDARDGRPLRVLALGTPDQSVDTVLLDTVDDRPVVVAATDTAVRIWDADTGECLRTLEDQRRPALGRIDGEPVLATTSSTYRGQAELWRLRTGEAIRSLPGYSCAALGSVGDQPVLATTLHDSKVELRHAETGTLLRVLEGHKWDVKHLVLGAVDGRPAALTTSGEMVRIWDLSPTSGQIVPVAHTGEVTDVTAGLVGDRVVLATGGDDGTVRLWDAGTGECLYAAQLPFREQANGVALGAINGQPVLAATTDFGTLLFWDALTGSPRKELVGKGSVSVAVAVGALGGNWVVATARDDRTARIWDGRADAFVPPLTGHEDDLLDIAVGAVTDRLVVATASRDGTARLWDAGTGECLRRLAGHTGPVVAVAMGAVEDQPVVATAGDDGTVRLWDAGTGECLSVLAARPGGVRDVSLGTADGRPIVVGGMDRAVRVWDARTATPLVVIESALDVNAVCAGPGSTIAFACPAGFAVIRGG